MNTLRARSLLRTQQGFAIVAAIFLLVTLSALGAFMLNFSNTQHLTSAQDIQGSRAYWAAKAGVQWAAANIQPAAACPAAATLTLDGFAVAVTCTSNTYTEGSDTRIIYWVQSTATSAGSVGSIGYSERAINSFIEF